MNELTEEQRSYLTKRRWVVLIASCLVNLCIGALYAWSVFASPMAEVLSEATGATLTAASLAIVFSIGNGDGFITLIGGGFLNQKIGPRWVIFFGGILFGLGFVICGMATNVGMLILGYGICSGLGMGLAYGCTISNTVKFFPDNKGLIGGIATASYGISSVILPPVANALINAMGVRTAFIAVGIFCLVVVGVCSQLIVKCPVGFRPSGWDPRNADAPVHHTVDRNWHQMLKDPIFYVMLVMLFFGAVLGMMSISQASNVAQSMIGMSASAAAVVVSVLALFNTFGRILAGFISDRIGCVNTLTAVFVVAIGALSLIYLSAAGSVPLFYVGICLVGLCFGAFMGVYPSFTNGQFGAKYSSVNYGIMFIGFSAAGIAGPMIMSQVYGMFGTYRPAFLIALALAVCGLALTFLYRAVHARTGHRHLKSSYLERGVLPKGLRAH